MLLFFLGIDGFDKCVYDFVICYRFFLWVYYVKWYIYNLNIFKGVKSWY